MIICIKFSTISDSAFASMILNSWLGFRWSKKGRKYPKDTSGFIAVGSADTQAKYEVKRTKGRHRNKISRHGGGKRAENGRGVTMQSKYFQTEFYQTGWVCPKCGRVYSPSAYMCSFCGPGSGHGGSVSTGTTGIPIKPGTYTTSNSTNSNSGVVVGIYGTDGDFQTEASHDEMEETEC